MKPVNTRSVHVGYNFERGFREYHEVVAELVCNYTKDDASILDIGCGAGHILSKIREKMPHLMMTAADIDKKCLELTEQRVGCKKIHIKEIEELFSTPLMFDTIIMCHSLEHMYRPVDIVRGVLKLLSPNGILVLAVPNPVRPTVFYGNILKRHYVNRGHVYAWDRSHWMNFLENILTLNVVCYSQDLVPLPFLQKFKKNRLVNRFEKSLAKVLPWLSASNIAVIRKVESSSEKY